MYTCKAVNYTVSVHVCQFYLLEVCSLKKGPHIGGSVCVSADEAGDRLEMLCWARNCGCVTVEQIYSVHATV
jgi:hypothetical protein